MTDELKPCPFCGEDGEIYHMLYPYEAYVPRCSSDGDCLCTLMEFHTRDQAVKAWNTRAERTCKFIPFIEDDGSIFVENCSECDAAVLSRCEFNYCPKCGAKVIDHER